jgi:hypothetical protein
VKINVSEEEFASIFRVKYWDSRFLRKINIFLKDNKVSHPRRQQYLTELLFYSRKMLSLT